MKYIECVTCGKTEDLMKGSVNKYGTQYYRCRKCNTERANKYRAKNRDKIRKISSRQARKSPVQRRAYSLVSLHKKLYNPCEYPNCKVVKTDAHHEDYSRPLDVIWLCRQHHADLHKYLKMVSK